MRRSPKAGWTRLGWFLTLSLCSFVVCCLLRRSPIEKTHNSGGPKAGRIRVGWGNFWPKIYGAVQSFYRYHEDLSAVKEFRANIIFISSQRRLLSICFLSRMRGINFRICVTKLSLFTWVDLCIGNPCIAKL